MAKIIYSGFYEIFWLDVATHLQETYDWDPYYWIGSSKTENQVKERFPQAIYHDLTAAVKNIPPLEFGHHRLHALDKPLLDGLAQCEIRAMNMMDRMDAMGAFNYHDRLRHYYNLLEYWLTVLEELKPDFVLFKEIPHLVFDYILYEACQYKGIKTIMFQISNLRRLWILMDSIYGDHEVIKEYQTLLENPPQTPLSLSPSSEKYLKSFQADAYDKVPKTTRFVKKKDVRSVSRTETFFRRISRFQDYPVYIQKQRRILKSKLTAPRNYLKAPGKTIEQSSMDWFTYRYFRYRAKRKMAKLAAYYHRLADSVDLTKPYIYVALTYQPEANSSPKGGNFADLRLMVRLMARNVPADWMIYVKEHPSQLHPSWSFRSHTARAYDFYDDLVAMPNVRLVRMDLSPFDLIDNARAIATLTGTTAFQAVNRGKPAFIFGYPWYRGCEGIFHIETVQAFQEAMAKILSGYEIDLEKVRLFIFALEKVGVSDYVEGKWQQYFPESYNPTSMAEKIFAFSQRI